MYRYTSTHETLVCHLMSHALNVIVTGLRGCQTGAWGCVLRLRRMRTVLDRTLCTRLITDCVLPAVLCGMTCWLVDEHKQVECVRRYVVRLELSKVQMTSHHMHMSHSVYNTDNVHMQAHLHTASSLPPNA